MRVAVMPADMAGCGFYRLIAASEYLQMLGHDIRLQYPNQKDIGLKVHFRGDANDPNAEMVDVEIPFDADVLVMQRISHNWHTQLVPLLRKKGITIVIDMDDDLSSIHPDNQAFRNYHPRNIRTPFSWKNVERACKDATLVTVSTRQLLNVYAKHGRGVVIDNYVPQRYLQITPKDRDKVFGWAGTTQSHPNDLQVCAQGVQQLISDGYEFRVVGPKSKVQQALRLKDEPTFTGVVSLFDWPAEVAKLQVSICPLAATQFNQGKSRLKAIEANSTGVPFVASPRAEYRRYVKESGGGLLAETGKEWFANVKRLMDDANLRHDLGEAGRMHMQTQTIEANAWRLWEAWEHAYNIQHGKVKVA